MKHLEIVSQEQFKELLIEMYLKGLEEKIEPKQMIIEIRKKLVGSVNTAKYEK